MDMKADVVRLPSELSRMPSVSVQLKMDEISTISKLAKGVTPHSVITQAPPTATSTAKILPKESTAVRSKSPKPVKSEVVVSEKVFLEKQSTAPKYKVAYAASSSGGKTGPQVLPPNQSGLAMQTPEGLVVYSVASTATVTQSGNLVQAGTTSTSTSNAAIAIGVPTYLEGYSTVQLVPTGSTQQVVYLPPVVGSTQSTAAAQVTTVPAVTGSVGSQFTVLQNSPAVIQQSVQYSAADSSGGTTGRKVTKNNTVITID